MRLVAKEVDVDSGSIVIVDPALLGKRYTPANWRGGSAGFKGIPKGTYSCSWEVVNSSVANAKGKGTLKVVSGIVLIADPCYIDKEGAGARMPAGAVIVSKTGGDGTFTVVVNLHKK